MTPFEQLDPRGLAWPGLAFDRAGAPGQGEAVHDGVPVALKEGGEALDRRGPP